MTTTFAAKTQLPLWYLTLLMIQAKSSWNLRAGIQKRQLDLAKRVNLFSTCTLPHSKSPSSEPPIRSI